MKSVQKIFVKITNWQIYCKIENMEKSQQEHFKLIEKRLDVMNGKVKLNQWISATALTLVVMVIGVLLKFSL